MSIIVIKENLPTIDEKTKIPSFVVIYGSLHVFDMK
jgi:hypothetical protein